MCFHTRNKIPINLTIKYRHLELLNLEIPNYNPKNYMNKLLTSSGPGIFLWLIIAIGANFAAPPSSAQDTASNFSTTIFSEDFEGVELGASVDEGVSGEEVWSKTGLEGWAIDDSGVPGAGDPDNDGVTEWAGWSFASIDWWVETAGDQGRSQFTAGSGTALIADGDEWDDISPRAEGNQTTYISTPEIELGSAVAGSLSIAFDSSYAADGGQESGTVDVSYDGGANWNQILLWNRANTPQDKNYESVSISADNPQGAETAMFRFGYINVGNNWWFAIDNVEVKVVRPTVLFEEDFEGVELGASVDEGVSGEEVWSKTGPEGWMIDDSGVPGAGDPDNDGVTEWAGWSFASIDWWVETAGDQGRSQFTAGSGTALIADGDEWDDISPRAEGNQTTYISTPAIDITGVLPGSLVLTFDSSYAADGGQESGTVDVSYDDGATWNQILLWNRANTPQDKNYESVALRVTDTPADAASAKFRFGYINVGNNWWFAIDNILVHGSKSFWTEDFESVELGPNVDEGVSGEEVWSKTGPEGWTIDDSGVPGAGDPDNDGVTEWAGWSFADKDWWVETAGDQGRSQFTAGSGTALIADGDEWDDISPRAEGNQTTYVSTPDIDISELGTAAIVLTADTSYAADGSQESGNVEVSFDKGETWTEILLWTRANTPSDKNYESIALKTALPAGAETVRYKFGYINVGNNWWFAIDNLALFGLDEVPPSIADTIPGDEDSGVDPSTSIAFVIDPGTVGVNVETLSLSPAGDPDTELAITSETNDDGQLVVTHDPESSFPFGEVVSVVLGFDDLSGTPGGGTLTFTVDDPHVPERFDIDKDNRGFLLLTKINTEINTSNNHARAENQLFNRGQFRPNGEPAENLAEPFLYDYENEDFVIYGDQQTYIIEEDVINYDQDATPEAPTGVGEVGENGPIPGVGSTNNGIAMEGITFLEFEGPGYFQMGFNSDDGFKLTTGPNFRAPDAPIAGEFEGGRGAATTAFSILIPEAGLYPFRFIWYEGGGGANLEWWHVGSGGERILINSDHPEAIKAWRPDNPLDILPPVLPSSPVAGSTGVAPNGALAFQIGDGGAVSLNPDDFVLNIEGIGAVEPTITKDDETGLYSITWAPSELFAPGENVNATLEYSYGSGDNKTTKTLALDYMVENYPKVGFPVSNPSDPGFNFAISEVGLVEDVGINPELLMQFPNTIGRAETQLAGLLTFNENYDNLEWNTADQVIDSVPRVDIEQPIVSLGGFFEDFDNFIELPGWTGESLDLTTTAVELSGFIELPEGYTRFGLNVAGGARITIGGADESSSNPASLFQSFEWLSTPATPGYHEEQFGVFVEQAGVYPIRIVYFQGGSFADSIGIEFYSVTPTGERVLVNAPGNDDAIMVYQNADTAFEPFVEAALPTPIDPSYISDGLIGVLLNQGGEEIDPESISVELNGEGVPNSKLNIENLQGGRFLVTIEISDFIVPESWHSIRINYADVEEAWVFNGLSAGSPDGLNEIFFEDFDGAETMPAVDENISEEIGGWTREFPGWPVDASGVPGFDSPDADGDGFGDADGVSEWAGWTFADIEFWQAADGQRRTEFTNAGGVVLVADPDEWDDTSHAPSAENGWYNTLVDTPTVDISGDDVVPNGMVLEFDSSWRPECDGNYRQSARIWVSFDGGERRQILLWTSCDGPFFKDDNSTNEHIIVPLGNPEGASNVKITFEMFDAGNDWWWAIDNVALKGSTEGAVFRSQEDASAIIGLGGGDSTPLPPGSLVASTDQTNITISWADQEDGTFQVQKRASLTSGSWENVGTPTTDKSFTEAVDSDKAFYRVIRQ